MTSFKKFFNLFKESKEIAHNIKNRNKEEVYKLAIDIRHHIEDYPDINLYDLYKDSLYYFPLESDDKIFYVYSPPTNKKVLEKRLKDVEEFLKELKEADEIDGKAAKENDYFIKRHEQSRNLLKKRLENFQEKQIIGIDKKDYLDFYYTDPTSSSFAEQNLYELEKKKNKKIDLNSDEFHKAYQSVYSLNQYMKKIYASVNSNQLSSFSKFKLTNSDKKYIFKALNIRTPDIYQYLLKIGYNLPKHPSELPKDFLDAPKFIMNSFVRNWSLVQIANNSCRVTSGNYSGNFQILQPISDSTYNITNKEAKKWLLDEIKRYNDEERGEYVDGDSYAELLNFPSYTINHTKKSKEAIVALMHSNMSFSTIKTFRWFIHNINSTYFYKKKIVYGPANQARDFLPIDHIVQIAEIDLDNGIKTSPEKAFNNASARKAREFEESNRNREFEYDYDYVDTDFVKVIRSSDALKYEGERMNHCVGGYSASCLSKRSLILHLPDSTAELNPETLEVYQHRGRGNSNPSNEDRKHLKDWIKVNIDSSK